MSKVAQFGPDVTDEEIAAEIAQHRREKAMTWERVVVEAMRRYHFPGDTDERTADIAIQALRAQRFVIHRDEGECYAVRHEDDPTVDHEVPA